MVQLLELSLLAQILEESNIPRHDPGFLSPLTPPS
jgi:hypothetical protein